MTIPSTLHPDTPDCLSKHTECADMTEDAAHPAHPSQIGQEDTVGVDYGPGKKRMPSAFSHGEEARVEQC